MTKLLLNVICLFLFLFQCFGANPFSPNTVLVSGHDFSGYVLLEYDLLGNQVQKIDLPTGKSCPFDGCKLTTDAFGYLSSIPMYTGSSAPYTIYGYTYNVQGNIAYTTTLVGQAARPSSMVVNGQDTWFAIGGSIVYQARGTTGTGTTIFSASTISFMQLISTSLYALIGTDLAVMDSPVTSGSGLFIPILPNVGAFYISGTTLYTSSLDNTVITKYSIINGVVKLYSIDVSSNTQVSPSDKFKLFSVSFGGGAATVLAAYFDGTDSFIYQITDTGSAFGSPTQLATVIGGLYYSMANSPQPSCSDTFKNGAETDVDCGGGKCGGCALNKVCAVDADCISSKCTSLVCAISCTDGVKNQDETDVDCGGLICTTRKCAIGKICLVDGDCSSSKCTAGFCAPSCTDGIKNQGETDIDCGGPCPKCANAKTCSSNSDCVNNYCNPSRKCATPTCSDTAQNQDETDIDCGGATCPKCAVNKACSGNTDCASSYCNPLNKCSVPSCSDTFKNQDETDTDCGGLTCGGCAIDKVCALDGDCLSSKCTSLVCAASCSDGIANQDETDVDCGGLLCNKCPDSKSCKVNTDCTNNYCNGTLMCETPTCSDGVKNQDETDIDCGGLICNDCTNGKVCAIDGDCLSTKCSNLVCADSCFDGLNNQDETDIDCGGSICSKCDNSKTCALNTDCTSSYCNPNLLCSTPSCNDGFKNRDESDIDCGGSNDCNKCSLGQQCDNDSDCVSNSCNSVCVNPPVAPVEAPVNTPVDTPISTAPLNQSPQSDSPSGSPPLSSNPASTPVRKLISVSAASVVIASVFGLVINFVLSVL